MTRPPVVLAVDTAAARGGVALGSDGPPTAVRDLGERGRHAEAVVPAMLEVLEEAGLGWSDLDLLVVGVGPGSFTGIRVGVAAVLGVAEARNLPAHGAGCLDITARACYDATSPAIGAYIVSVADVRRGEVVIGSYRVAGDGPEATAPERLVPVSEPGPEPPPGARVAGDGASLVWPGAGFERWVPSGTERAAAAVRLGVRALAEGGLSPPVPRYARAADARPRRS